MDPLRILVSQVTFEERNQFLPQRYSHKKHLAEQKDLGHDYFRYYEEKESKFWKFSGVDYATEEDSQFCESDREEAAERAKI